MTEISRKQLQEMKLTEVQKLLERRKLEERLTEAIEKTPKCITEGQIRDAILRVCIDLNLVS